MFGLHKEQHDAIMEPRTSRTLFQEEFCIQFALCAKAYLDGLIKRMKSVDHPSQWSDDTMTKELRLFEENEPQAGRLFQFTYLSHLDLIGRKTAAANSGSHLYPFFRVFVTSFANSDPRMIKEYVDKYNHVERTDYVQELVRSALRTLTNDVRDAPASSVASRRSLRSARGVSEKQQRSLAAGSVAASRISTRPQSQQATAKLLSVGGGSVFQPHDSVSVVPIVERSVASLWKATEGPP